jgi:D-2-hydroxyacid dehydrogenase (NADP+)
MLWHAKKLTRFMDKQAHKLWKPEEIVNLSTQTLTVLGYGGIGSACAKVAKLGFGTRVIAVDKFEITDPVRRSYADEILGLDQLERAVREADFVVGVLPHTKETNKMICINKVFSKMKPTGVFMNIGRGTTVNEPDLIQALEEKLIAGACLDVTTNEPLEATSKLWSMPNVLLYPHSAAIDPNIRERAVNQFLENLDLWKQGKPLLNYVEGHKGF